MSTCNTTTVYPVMVVIGEKCRCERPLGHEGDHLGKGRGGQYFSWHLNAAYGSILHEPRTDQEAREILEADGGTQLVAAE